VAAPIVLPLQASAIDPAAAAHLAATTQVAATLHPVPDWQFDGDWPALAAALPLRGVVQQLALQAELLGCDPADGGLLRLRVPLETLASAANVEKLASALGTHFGTTVRLAIEIGTARDTANARTESARVMRQRDAEQQVRSDPSVLAMMREFGATIVPGSIKPI
ncbi:MAG: DNA polymerase III subunit gamma/tau, partial [Pseudomonadota bacterium]|nr:DNA polymerase III subunit gamma/tau [Pseudomonadota bacterium]